jgi:eukaryotic-like serine/threonine-protein kinase
MNPERWELVAKIFDAALDQPQSARNDFVRQGCKDDEELEAEVLRLLAADEQAGSFLERRPFPTTQLARPARTISPLAAGTTLAGRFKILRFIGQGGMGQVYEALDLELNGKVALKVIRPDISSDARMLSRFRREVQLTRRITHPNVCRTFDIERHSSTADDGTSSDLTFLTMELLEGETLADLLHRQGRLTEAEALPLVLQMTEALNAAHAASIVHRDFKPSNVLLVPVSGSSTGLRVVVTDFGLARALLPGGQVSGEQAATSLTGNQALMGTLIYMAPEQFERGEATVASDLYSLGLVMYEMVTGVRPFADPIPFAEATKRVKQPAPSSKILVPELDPAWEAAICRCLEAEPEKRFQTARELADSLPESQTIVTAKARSSSSSNRLPNDPRRPTGRQNRHIIIIACSAFLAVSLLGLFLRHYIRREAPIQFAERDWILVIDFNNQTGEKVFDRVARDLTVQSLSQSTYVNVVPRLSALEAAKRTGIKDVSSIDEKLGRELCLRENYKALLTGDVFKDGSRYVITIKVVVPGRDVSAILDSESMESPDEIFASVDRLTARIRQALGESLSRIETNRKPLAHVTTPSLEALQRYSTALDLYGEGEYARCVALGNDAVERDPKFAMAHLLLAQAHEKMGDEASSRGQLELARAGLDRVGERERHLILAVGYSHQLMNEKAAEEYQHLLDIFPDDVDALKGFAYEAFWAGHPDQAIAAQYRALALSPGDADSYDTLMTLLVRSNRFSDTLAIYNQARSRHLTAPNLNFLAALATWGAGDLARAREMLEALSDEGSNWKVVSRLFVGKLLAFQGRMGEALEVFRTGLNLVQAPGLEYWIPNFQYQIARAEVVRGKNTAARTECRRLRKAAERVPMPINLQRAGRLSIQIGDLQSAKHLEALGREQVTPHPDPFSEMELHGLAGDIALASGEASEAEQEQRSALTFRRWYTPYFSMGEACEAAGKWKCAVEAYSRYLDFEGAVFRDDAAEDWAIAHYSLARAYVKSGDPASGNTHYQEFLSLFASADPGLPILSQVKHDMMTLRVDHPGKGEKR